MVENQKRNTAQLAKIGAIVEQRWGFEGENKKKESRDDKEESEDGTRESQEEVTSSSAFY